MNIENLIKAIRVLYKNGTVSRIVPDYGGRNMYGATCLGIVIEPDSDALSCMLQLGSELQKLEPSSRLFEDLVIRTDNLGYDKIVYFVTIPTEAVKSSDQFNSWINQP